MSALGMGGPPQGAPASPATIQIGGGDPPAGGSDDTATDGGGKSSEDWLAVAKQALQKAEGLEEDHVESAMILKWIQGIQQLLGDRQKGSESALGVTPAMKAMSRAYTK